MRVPCTAQIDGQFFFQGLLNRLFDGGHHGVLHLLTDRCFDIVWETSPVYKCEVGIEVAAIMERRCVRPVQTELAQLS